IWLVCAACAIERKGQAQSTANARIKNQRIFMVLPLFPGFPLASLRVVFAVGSEDVQHLGVFEGGGLVIEDAVDDDAVAGAEVPLLAFGFKDDVAADDVDHLVMGMLVAGGHPPPFGVVGGG